MNSNEQLNLLKVFFLVSAILNILCGITWVMYTIIGGILSCGIGCLLGFFPIINIIACVMDFVAYGKLANQNKTGTYGTIQFASIFDIISILTGNVISAIVGIIGLVFLNNNDVRSYLVQKGIY